jgi:hypothetical protein
MRPRRKAQHFEAETSFSNLTATNEWSQSFLLRLLMK